MVGRNLGRGGQIYPSAPCAVPWGHLAVPGGHRARPRTTASLWHTLLAPASPGQWDQVGPRPVHGRVKAGRFSRARHPALSACSCLPGCSWAVRGGRSPAAPDFRVGTLPGLDPGASADGGARVREQAEVPEGRRDGTGAEGWSLAVPMGAEESQGPVGTVCRG